MDQRSIIEPAKRPPLLAALHWTTAAVLLVGVAAILARELVEAKTGRASLLEVHRWCGVLILVLTTLRLLLRAWSAPLPDLLPHRPARSRLVASAAHMALYAFLVALPVLGWWSLATNDEDLGERLHDWHVALAFTFIGLIAIHAAAACWHQFIRREPVVRAMWPWPSFIQKRGDTP